jgi:hypothetical protein
VIKTVRLAGRFSFYPKRIPLSTVLLNRNVLSRRQDDLIRHGPNFLVVFNQ